MNRSLFTAVALAGIVALTGCADLGYLGGNGGYGDYRRAPNDRYEDYGYRGDYERRINRDASVYAGELDRYLRISNREERAIRDLLVRRTYDYLDRGGAYPFPRQEGYARSFWSYADRDIERILDRRYHEPYRYYNRYGARRYQDYYRYRRYDDRRGWYDTRRDDGRREDRARERREDQREADRRRDRQEDRRETRRDRQEDQREARRERQDDRRERQQSRQEQRQEERRQARPDRREETRRAAPSRRSSAEQARQSREEQRRRDRRGGND